MSSRRSARSHSEERRVEHRAHSVSEGRCQKEAEISKVTQITKKHHHTHRHGGRQHEETAKSEAAVGRSRDESEIKKWRTTFEMVSKLLSKTAKESYSEPTTDEGRRALLVEMAGSVCKKANSPTESREYKDLEAKYEHQQRKTKRMQKRAERMLQEVEGNRARLDAHLKKVKLGELTETDKILKGIDALMLEQAENHRLFLEADTPSPRKSTNKIAPHSRSPTLRSPLQSKRATYSTDASSDTLSNSSDE